MDSGLYVLPCLCLRIGICLLSSYKEENHREMSFCSEIAHVETRELVLNWSD